MSTAINHLTVNDYAELLADKFFLQGTFYRSLMSTVHDHDFYEICYVLEGGCTQLLNGVPHEMTEGDTVIFRPGDTHGFISQQPRTNMFSLSVCIESMELFLQAYGDFLTSAICDSPGPILFRMTARQQNDFRTAFESILPLNSARRLTRIKIILDQVLQYYMLYLDRRISGASANTHLLEALSQFNTPEHIREGVPALLQLTNFSHAHLCRIMKSAFGVTPQQYVVSLRLNLAMELLQGSDLSVDAVVAQTGYSSPSHFNKIFIQHFGLTPSEARRKYRMHTI